ncbi:related to TPT1 - tRNA 2`-phosphotransferase [Ustilago trichophora]|uniref:2'-phosphotransferase n=1 Tax=Ustilago trichophora TaxID=86804 RepID=A0A5C3EKG8_9BASI|nr:related to TPT1 - tRNA 2`-phosphotransferase [Ustilago trichophora]
MSSEAPLTTTTTVKTEAEPPSGVNLERKARKEAAKLLKAQQSADKKKAAAAKATTASSSCSSKSTSKDKNPRKPQSPTEQLSRALAYILRHGAEKEGLSIRSNGYVQLDHVLERPRVKSVNMLAETETQAKGAKRRPNVQDVQQVTQANDKKRFQVMQDEDRVWWIRAVQGHSLKSIAVEHTPLTLNNLHLLKLNHSEKDDEDEDEDEDDALAGEINSKLNLTTDQEQQQMVEVIHGTYQAAWQEILSSGGLKPMTRTHIHLAKGKFGQQGVISGMRKSANRLIFVDIKKAINDGVRFELSSNGVVLTPGADESGLLEVKYFTRVEDQNGQIVWQPSSQNPSE